jgi:CheY-like chemotaxis protein
LQLGQTQPQDAPQAPRPIHAGTVLVVDDSRFVRASIVRALAADFTLQQAESGERAWELLLLDGSIAAVLSDLTMPGMDGFELLRRVRESALPRIRSLPFAVLSGADEPAQRERARTLGADRFVVKGDGFDGVRDWLRTGQGPDAPATDAVRDDDRPSPAGVTRVVPDPLQRWLRHQLSAPVADGSHRVLIRLHAPGFDDLAARLRRGVRAADAVHQDGADLAWLFVAASAPVAVKLSLRFGLLAAGRGVGDAGNAASVVVSMLAVDRMDPAAALAALQDAPAVLPPPGRIAVDCAAGAWGAAWHFDVPWAAARLLIG